MGIFGCILPKKVVLLRKIMQCEKVTIPSADKGDAALGIKPMAKEAEMMEPYQNTEWIQYDEGLRRFAGREDLYRKYLLKFTVISDFDALCAAMQDRRYADAFRYAHSLKGNAGNLSLSRLYAQMQTITELLRSAADIDGAIRMLPALQEDYRKTISEIKQLLT
ncbi:MAG: Hpt domain-containing protein [Oscillibacter sp.]|nr:Hpt domain-containing protein [Oscillibacter sp.]